MTVKKKVDKMLSRDCNKLCVNRIDELFLLD